MITAKDRVRRTYPNARDWHPRKYEVWSEGYGKGVLLAQGQTRSEAWEKALYRINGDADTQKS